jgi:hypothetical protein
LPQAQIIVIVDPSFGGMYRCRIHVKNKWKTDKVFGPVQNGMVLGKYMLLQLHCACFTATVVMLIGIV